MKFTFSSKKLFKILFGIFLIWVCITCLMSKKVVEGAKNKPPPGGKPKITRAELVVTQKKIQSDVAANLNAANAIQAKKMAAEEAVERAKASASNVDTSATNLSSQMFRLFTW